MIEIDMKKMTPREATDAYFKNNLERGYYAFFVEHILDDFYYEDSCIIYGAPEGVSDKLFHYKEVKVEDLVLVAFPHITEIMDAGQELEGNMGDALGVVFYNQHTKKGDVLKCFLAGFPPDDENTLSGIVSQKNIPNLTDDALTTEQMEVLVRYLKTEFKRNKKYADEGAR